MADWRLLKKGTRVIFCNRSRSLNVREYKLEGLYGTVHEDAICDNVYVKIDAPTHRRHGKVQGFFPESVEVAEVVSNEDALAFLRQI